MPRKIAIIYSIFVLSLIPIARPIQNRFHQLLPYSPYQMLSDNWQHWTIAGIVVLTFFLVKDGRYKNNTVLALVALAIFFLGTACNILVKPVELSHIAIYAVLALLWFRALQPGYNQYLRVFLCCSMVSLLDEGLQSICPGRIGDWRDLLINLHGYTIGMILIGLFRLTETHTKHAL